MMVKAAVKGGARHAVEGVVGLAPIARVGASVVARRARAWLALGSVRVACAVAQAGDVGAHGAVLRAVGTHKVGGRKARARNELVLSRWGQRAVVVRGYAPRVAVLAPPAVPVCGSVAHAGVHVLVGAARDSVLGTAGHALAGVSCVSAGALTNECFKSFAGREVARRASGGVHAARAVAEAYLVLPRETAGARSTSLGVECGCTVALAEGIVPRGALGGARHALAVLDLVAENALGRFVEVKVGRA